MIDEKKLLDWLTQRKNDSFGSDRLAYRELLSRIENGEFEHQAVPALSRPGDVVWADDDDLW